MEAGGTALAMAHTFRAKAFYFDVQNLPVQFQSLLQDSKAALGGPHALAGCGKRA
jgi:hypothetical protein